MNGNQQEAAVSALRDLLDAVRVDPTKTLLTKEEQVSLERFLFTAEASDDGNAQCILRFYPNRFLWCGAYGWMQYRDGYWTSENAEAALDGAVVETLQRRSAVASTPENFKSGDHIRKFCNANRNRLEGAKALLRHKIAAEAAEFDAHKDLLNVANGVVDLRTGELLAHDPAYRFLHRADVRFDPLANTKIWVDWLTETVAGGADTVDWLQLAVGYTLTGHTSEEVMFYLFGPGRSGKGTFTSALQAVLGHRLAQSVEFSVFTAKREVDTQNFAFAPLQPARMVIASESDKNERFNAAKVKNVTGGDAISCAFKFHDRFDYNPSFKIWLSSNHPINADPDDDALWSRIRLIEFPNSHIGKEDRSLKHLMQSDAVQEGILAWAVQGAQRWYALGKQGMPELGRSTDAKQQHRDAQDSVKMWLDENAILEPGAITSSKDLYNNYEWWCEANGFSAKKQRGLTQALRAKGCEVPNDPKYHDGRTQRVVIGLRLMQV